MLVLPPVYFCARTQQHAAHRTGGLITSHTDTELQQMQRPRLSRKDSQNLSGAQRGVVELSTNDTFLKSVA